MPSNKPLFNNMALLFFDGFDHYSVINNKPTGKWDTYSTGSFLAGRFGGQCVTLNGPNNGGVAIWPGLTKSFDQDFQPPIIVGAAIIITAFTGFYVDNVHGFMHFITDDPDGDNYVYSIAADYDTHALEVRYRPVGQGEYVGQTVIATSSYVIPVNLWQYIEVKLDSTGGEIRVEDEIICTFSAPIGAREVSRVRFTGISNFNVTGMVDDVYIADSSGSINNSFIGAGRVAVAYPNVDGSQQDFIPAVPTTHYPNVNIPVTNFTENGEYVYKGTIAAIELYKVDTSVVSIDTIAGIQVNVAHKKDNDGTRGISPLIHTPTTGDTLGLRVWPEYMEYTNAHAIFETNPDTNAVWTLSDVTGAEFGLKIMT